MGPVSQAVHMYSAAMAEVLHKSPERARAECNIDTLLAYIGAIENAPKPARPYEGSSEEEHMAEFDDNPGL